MIPVSLSLKNFLSYGEDVPPLDFTEFDIACLSGNNGHGKSAILDAITWALWGEARKASGDRSPADGLLRLGSTDMRVEFEFDLEGDRYRVIRKFHRRKSAAGNAASLDFQVFDQASNGFKPLTESSSKHTQDRINATLRMNYETFINSAFILQGRVDEFTKKTPHKRKEILADILDLQQYDTLVELAKRHQQQAKTDMAVVEARLESIKDEVSHQAEYERRFDELTQRLDELDQQIATQDAARHALQQQQAELLTKQAQLREKQQQRQQLASELEQLAHRVKRQQEEIRAVQTILDQRDAIVRDVERYETLTQQNRQLEQQAQDIRHLQAQQAFFEQVIDRARHELEAERKTLHSQQAQFEAQLRDSEHLLNRTQEIQDGFQSYHQTKQTDEQLDETRNEVDRLERAISAAKREIDRHQARLIAEVEALTRRIAEIRVFAEKLPEHEARVAEYHRLVTETQRLNSELDQKKEAGTQCKTRLETLAAQHQQTQKLLDEAREKFDLLKRSDAPECPLCASRLDAQKKGELDAHFQRELLTLEQELARNDIEQRDQQAALDRLRVEYRQLEQQAKTVERQREDLRSAEHAAQQCREAAVQLEQLRQEHARLTERLEQKAFAVEAHQQAEDLQNTLTALDYDQQEHQALKKRRKALEKYEGEHAALTAALERERAIFTQLPVITQQIAEIQGTLDRQEFAQTERTQVEALRSQIAAIGYDEREHARIREELPRLQTALTQKARLEQAEKSLGQLQQTLDEWQQEQREKAARLSVIETETRQFEGELAAFPQIEQALHQQKAALETLQRERDQAIQEQGIYEHKYQRCLELAEEQRLKAQDFAQCERDVKLYGNLVRIFGKDGIQSFLIQNAIPDIEDEANIILSRLTQNKTHITIESQKDLQSGGTKETLDIKISDELGTRNYEMYSGGEAFRVDFSIRIALSKLLAKRAGTRLRTLVIDEGFGTQDAQALEQLVEAIKTISADFEKILVITHLETLKDAFPVRIEVVKYPDIGSQYQVVR
ncbi:SMC domain protein [Candidatus Moduliflexus flocculans]|uniref:SMC domain protein n=1 Tax=Candidatus Moduliflexus flocculans TaxID=1499966 RepID=A0A081BT81_9BACT|nr:SMC domain protein [Candidatus Moduliflexus flocculans]